MFETLIRFVRWVKLIQDAQAEVPKLSGSNPVEAGLKIVSKAGTSVYFIFDHLLYFNDIKLWLPADKSQAESVARVAVLGWGSQVVADAILTLIDLNKLQGDKSTEAAEKRIKLYLTLVKLLADFSLVLNSLKMTGDAEDGWFGLAGFVSSAIGVYEILPQPTKVKLA